MKYETSVCKLLESVYILSYIFVWDLPEDGHLKAETCRLHIGKQWTVVCCKLCGCWVKNCTAVEGFRYYLTESTR